MGKCGSSLLKMSANSAVVKSVDEVPAGMTLIISSQNMLASSVSAMVLTSRPVSVPNRPLAGHEDEC